MSESPRVQCDSPHLALPRAELVDFCHRWDVDELVLVGSAAHGPFGPDSDVDLLTFASYRTPLFAPEGWACAAAVREAEALVGRPVDFVSARQLAGTSNPYVAHNLLVRKDFDRTTGLLWFVRQAALAFTEWAPTLEARLTTPLQRRALLTTLLDLGRACDRPSRVAALEERGVHGPWAEVEAVTGDPLRAVRERRLPRWPSDADVLRVVREVVRVAPHLLERAAALLPPAPRPPPATIARARGDEPRAREPNDPPRLTLAPRSALAPSAPALHALCMRWGITTLIESFGGRQDGRCFVFAPTTAPVFDASARIAAAALADFAALGVALECARRVAVTGNPTLLYNAFVRQVYSPHESALWFVREAGRLLEAGARPSGDSKTSGDDRRLRVMLAGLTLADATLEPSLHAELTSAGVPWADLRAFAPAHASPTDVQALAARLKAPSAMMASLGAGIPAAGELAIPTALVLEAVGDMTPNARLGWLPSSA